jgi:Tol biopolymer transport system component
MTAHLLSCLGLVFSVVALAMLPGRASRAEAVGIFEDHGDIGPVANHGTAAYHADEDHYTLSGAGKNIWAKEDEFQFAWKKMKGDFILQARVRFIDKGVIEHRKIGWMIRESLKPDAAYVDIAVHGSGLTSLQIRPKAGENTTQTVAPILGPDVIQLERKGNKYTMRVAYYGQPFAPERTEEVELPDDVYVGLFVCSHKADVVEAAVFDNVRIAVPARDNFVPYRDYIGSNIEVMDVGTGIRKILYHAGNSLQAPNWTPDGKSLIYNADGKLYRFDLGTVKPTPIDTGDVNENNNDHVLSFDGKMLGISSRDKAIKQSAVYTVPVEGGTPKLITPTGPSYLHGWSPDGKWLVFTGGRNNIFDIYKISSSGEGKEQKLTDTPTLDDGPEFTPDGKFIYFNSTRTGTMQLWRMQPTGNDPEQLTDDEFNNWFPHISPDGKSIVFLSFLSDVKPDDHPFYKRVYIRMMPFPGGPAKVLAYVYGGQGTMNVPSWSPDSKKIAFVSNTAGD